MILKIFLSSFMLSVVCMSQASEYGGNSALNFNASSKLKAKIEARRIQAILDDPQTEKFMRVIDMYKEQAEYHQHMADLLTEKTSGDIVSNFWDIFGLPDFCMQVTFPGAPLPKGTIRIRDAAQIIIDKHKSHATSYKSLFRSRKDQLLQYESTQIIKQIAGIYMGAVLNISDTEDNIIVQKQNLMATQELSEAETENHYFIKLLHDKINFYKRIQHRIIQNYFSDLEGIRNEMAIMAKFSLQRDPSYSEELRASEKNLAFYNAVLKNAFYFPSAQELEAEINILENTSPSEEVPSPCEASTKKSLKNKKKKERKKRALAEKKRQALDQGDPFPLLLPPTEAPSPLPSNTLMIVKEEKKQELSLEEIQELTRQLEDQYAKDRIQKKKKRIKQPKIASEPIKVEKTENDLSLKINKNNYTLLQDIFAQPTNTHIRWEKIVNLFQSPGGFKGRVYGTKNGASHTFEIYIMFKDGSLNNFLSCTAFNNLKEKAKPELKKDRSFLPHNGRMESYKLDQSYSLAFSYFTLHNPHPSPFAYAALIERLQQQLVLLDLKP